MDGCTLIFSNHWFFHLSGSVSSPQVDKKEDFSCHDFRCARLIVIKKEFSRASAAARKILRPRVEQICARKVPSDDDVKLLIADANFEKS